MAFYFPRRERDQIALTGRGLIAETYQLVQVNNVQTLTSQTVYFSLLGLRAGDVVTNVVVDVTTVAAGTTPTAMYVALYQSDGTRLAVSNDLKASAIWTAATGPVNAALSAAYTVLADDEYYVAVLANGTWGTTQLQLGRAAPDGSAVKALSGGAATFGTHTGQATMPVSATITAGTPAIWMGVS